MTKKQIREALAIALDGNIDLPNIDDICLDGLYTKEFQPVTVQLNVVAKMLRWHVVQLNGQIDQNELNNFEFHAKKKIMIV